MRLQICPECDGEGVNLLNEQCECCEGEGEVDERDPPSGVGLTQE